MATQPTRRTFLTVGGVGLAALLAGRPGLSAATAYAAADAYPIPQSGGTPPGPYTFGWSSQDLLDFDPASTPWGPHLRCHIPRAARIAPFAATQAHPDLDPATQLSTLTIDDAGSIYEGHNQPHGLEAQTYTQRFWPYIDIWGTWHGQVQGAEPIVLVDGERVPNRDYGVIDIPNPGWTEAAHKNGAMSIGGWFWPRPQDFDGFLVQNADGSFPVADKLIEMRTYFGFDGLFINQEGSVSADQIARFKDFLRYLKRTDPDFYLQGYDSAHFDQGYVTYENRLSANNIRWLGTADEPIYDSIFLNYGWPWADPDLQRSAAAARTAGRDPRVVGFAGVEHQMGGFRPYEDFGNVSGPGKPAPLSLALFVDTEIWLGASRRGETFTPQGRAKYRDLEQKFWSGPRGNPTATGRLTQRVGGRNDVENYQSWDGIAHYITERSSYGSLPIATDFNIGVGSSFWINGAKVRSTGWDNMGCADRSLTWQYWSEGDLTVALDETTSWGSAHSLAVAGAGVLHLFKTDLTAGHSMAASLRATGLTAVEVGLTWKDAPDAVEWFPLAIQGTTRGWDSWGGDALVSGRRIARISLRITGAGHLGRVVLREQGRPTVPGAPTGFAVKRVAQSGQREHLEFAWDRRSDVAGYDVLQVGATTTWLGRCHRGVFFAESVDLAAGTQFELVALSADGERSKPARTRL